VSTTSNLFTLSLTANGDWDFDGTSLLTDGGQTTLYLITSVINTVITVGILAKLTKFVTVSFVRVQVPAREKLSRRPFTH
jgi:hypothetical protein